MPYKFGLSPVSLTQYCHALLLWHMLLRLFCGVLLRTAAFVRFVIMTVAFSITVSVHLWAESA